MSRSSVQWVALNSSETAFLRAMFRSVRRTPYDADFAAFVDEVAGHVGQLPARLVAALTSFRRDLGHAGALIVSGIPVPDAIPPTPSMASACTSMDALGSEVPLVGCALLLGWPIGYADWHGGMRVQNLFPVASLRDTQCASNAVRLEFHTETAFRPTTPDGLMLLCLRGDLERRAETIMADLRIAIASLPVDFQEEFGQSQFAFRLSDGQLTEPKPIMYTGSSGERLHYAEALVGTTATARRALAMLAGAIASCSEAVRLIPGDLLVIDNRHMVHARSPLHARYDGSDRWLQRVLLRCL